MPASVFDLFSIGVGPSSSHTLGPMRAGRDFVRHLDGGGALAATSRLLCELYGSLALTGKGHCTDKALLAGLAGKQADEVAPGELSAIEEQVLASGQLLLLGQHAIPFDVGSSIVFRAADRLPGHANGMRFLAYDAAGSLLAEAVYYSVGGGFVVNADGQPIGELGTDSDFSFPYTTAGALLEAAGNGGLRIADIIWAWERRLRSDGEIRSGMLRIAAAMHGCIEAGLRTDGELPGGLGVRRRAPGLYRRLRDTERRQRDHGTEAMDWLSVYAIAVNEENAAMGRVVTAPTNGAAGVIPAVLRYYLEHMCGQAEEARRVKDTVEFLMVAGAIGILYKEGASLSAAEVGCQGEVGVACSMAAGALASVLGGTNAQVENAAEIGMEHNLGLTCDPVAGLVQIPCIERNSMGAVKAVNAARLALHSDGRHVVSLDRVIATMRKTGEDMLAHYKETSLGGLAIAVAQPEC
jgi:L-serine dehydratase